MPCPQKKDSIRFWKSVLARLNQSLIAAVTLSAFAVYGIASDAFLDRPFSARTPNNVIAIAFFLALLGWIFRPGLTPSRELRTLRIGALAVSLTALADNLRGLKVLRISGPEL